MSKFCIAVHGAGMSQVQAGWMLEAGKSLLCQGEVPMVLASLGHRLTVFAGQEGVLLRFAEFASC